MKTTEEFYKEYFGVNEIFMEGRKDNKTVLEFAAAYAHQSRDEGWISVEDRLPDVDEPVILLLGDGSVTSGNREFHYEYANSEHTNSENYYDAYEGIFTDDVTYWQPLPPPPVKDEKKGGRE